MSERGCITQNAKKPFPRKAQDQERQVIIPNPMPDERVADFISYLIKKGYSNHYNYCKAKCKNQLNIDIEKDILKTYSSEYIIKRNDGRGNEIVEIINKKWAGHVVDFFENRRGHHGKFPIRH
ncbi:MAG: hypothetical protein U9R75_10400 [Candidatus Thermoplasmatota archaeon]|nr:hypothetical protein [Candidatus Thermoplasmatota archaeon]